MGAWCLIELTGRERGGEAGLRRECDRGQTSGLSGWLELWCDVAEVRLGTDARCLDRAVARGRLLAIGCFVDVSNSARASACTKPQPARGLPSHNRFQCPRQRTPGRHPTSLRPSMLSPRRFGRARPLLISSYNAISVYPSLLLFRSLGLVRPRPLPRSVPTLPVRAVRLVRERTEL